MGYGDEASQKNRTATDVPWIASMRSQ